MEKPHDWLLHENKVGVRHVEIIHDSESTSRPREKVPCQGKKNEDTIYIKGLEKWAAQAKRDITEREEV